MAFSVTSLLSSCSEIFSKVFLLKAFRQLFQSYSLKIKKNIVSVETRGRWTKYFVAYF